MHREWERECFKSTEREWNYFVYICYKVWLPKKLFVMLILWCICVSFGVECCYNIFAKRSAWKTQSQSCSMYARSLSHVYVRISSSWITVMWLSKMYAMCTFCPGSSSFAPVIVGQYVVASAVPSAFWHSQKNSLLSRHTHRERKSMGLGMKN